MVNLGIIGIGGYGRTHVQGFLGLQAEGRVRIAALADTSSAALEELGALPELRKARCFTDYRALLAMSELDAVLLCIPIPFHREIALAALERGLFVLLEKPPVPLVSQLDELIHADRDGRVMVAFQHIYSPLVREAKTAILRGELGKLKSVAAHGVWPRPTSYYERAGWAGQLAWTERTVLDGPCTNAFAHYINLALHLCGNGDTDFASAVQIESEVYRARPEIASYDAALILGKLERDISFAAGFTHAAAESSRVKITLRGTHGGIAFSNDCETVRLPDGSVLQGPDGQQNMWEAFLALAGGDASQNRTPLRAVRPFVLATNLMFQSSGGIHAVPREFVRREGSGARTFFAIQDIGPLLAQGTGDGISLRQAGVKWAAQTTPVEAADFIEQEMLAVLAIPEERLLTAVS